MPQETAFATPQPAAQPWDFSLFSDTSSPAHPALVEAVAAASAGYVPSYGADVFTAEAKRAFEGLFGPDIGVFFVFNGTGANVLSLAAMAGRAAGVVCTDAAHINTHETGAPERLAGVKLLASPHENGKLLPRHIAAWAAQQPDEHCACPEVCSISETTEFGTVYTPAEVAALAEEAHSRGMLLHMDGARLANAVAALGCAPAALTRNAGVDVLCFGGTKNGFLFGEAVVVFNQSLLPRFAHLHKQYLQLGAKTRFISAQFAAALNDDLWLQTARQANAATNRIAVGLADIPQIRITVPVESNQIFVAMPPAWAADVEARCHAPVAADGTSRWVTSFNTTDAQVDLFLAHLRRLAEKDA